MIFVLIVNNVSVLLAYCLRNKLMPDVCKKTYIPTPLIMHGFSKPTPVHT